MTGAQPQNTAGTHFPCRNVPNKGIYTPKIATYHTSQGHFLTDIIGYDRLKLYLKIYTLKMKSWVRHCSRPVERMRLGWPDWLVAVQPRTVTISVLTAFDVE